MRRWQQIAGSPLEQDVSPKAVFLNRRAILTMGAALLASCTRHAPSEPPGPPYPAPRNRAFSVDAAATPRETAESYNNYIEFSAQSKELPRTRAQALPLRPWSVVVDGLVARPRTFSFEDLLRQMPFEERVCRFRCVEAWAMVVPWTGFPLAALLSLVEPLSAARYVSFTSASQPDIMPGMAVSEYYPWPYTEALTLAEAVNPLAMLVTGAYGAPLRAQNGAPIRLILPWKYGFKSAKAVVRISLLAERPETFWNTLQPLEYGFFANVNPSHPHPRWPQHTERLLPDFRSQPTLPFNGYAGAVALLYSGKEH
ncbi:MAG: protein-methionine-sulfoxide reductase catalytic subunit MsrP [Bryobacterales bacterium]|nr:protein-methionine-sulfoxide reductase catalytic subunit MsrP [Bryobacterales bacterium]